MSGRSPARAAAARNPARVRFAFATPSARCFQSEAGSRLRQAPPTTSPVPPAPASPATSACIPTPRGVPPAHPRPPRRQPFSPTKFSRRSTALKTHNRSHNRCAPALRARGYTVLNPEPKPENVSGITSFFAPDKNLAELHQRLAVAGVTASLRADRQGQKYLRFSPHYYVTDAELQRAVDLL